MYSYIDKEAVRIKHYLIDYGIATEEEINLVADINGFSEETMNDILYARTGYRDLSQLDED